MTTDTYFTIYQNTESLFKEKGSKFLAFAYPVENEVQVKEILQDLRKKYFDATHHCYAYILGYQQEIFRANDDGEPNNSAGMPILGQIRSRNLTNTLVVVVRYFGGTKLGVSGLIQAYKDAVADVLDKTEIVERQIKQKMLLRFDYIFLNEVMKWVKEFELDYETTYSAQDCDMNIWVRLSLLEQLKEKIEKSRQVMYAMD